VTIDHPPPALVPTLTEVVAQPAEAEQPAAPSDFLSLVPEDMAVPLSLPILSVTTETIAAALLQRIGPDLDRQIGETIARVLHEQMLGFNSRLQKAVAEVVHQAVVQGMSGGDQGSALGS
jgi:hypothetical protein